jgi:hypothetical protein
MSLFRWDNFKVDIDGVDLHFVHQKSSHLHAIPLLIVHGWPGTFHEFDQIIEPLINPPDGKTAFNVIIPSVPGFGFSSTPRRKGWTVKDSARLFDKLVTKVLGYESYAAQGGDWVSLSDMLADVPNSYDRPKRGLSSPLYCPICPIAKLSTSTCVLSRLPFLMLFSALFSLSPAGFLPPCSSGTFLLRSIGR